MWKFGAYIRNSDEYRVTKFICRNCRSTAIDKPLKTKKAHRGSGVVDFDESLGLTAKVKKCPYCGGKVVKNGHSKVASKLRVQVYLCKNCGKSFRFTTLLSKALKPLSPVCSVCSAAMNRNGRYRLPNGGFRQRYRCPRCGSTKPLPQTIPLGKSESRPANIHVANEVFCIMTDIILLSALKPENIHLVTKLGLVIRKEKFRLSYQSYASISRSPIPFRHMVGIDDNTIHRALESISEEALDYLIDYTYKLIKAIAPRRDHNGLGILAIDSSIETIPKSRLTTGSRDLKLHISVDITESGIMSASTKPFLRLEEVAELRVMLGDGEYWQISFVRWLKKGLIVPIIKPKRSESVDPSLEAARWLYKRYGGLIYRLRGIVESYIGFVFPHDNKSRAQKKENARKLLKIRCIAYNILTVSMYQDILLRRYLGVSLKDYLEERLQKVSTIDINPYQQLALQLLPSVKQEKT